MKRIITIIIPLVLMISCSKPIGDCSINMANIAGSYMIREVKYKANAGAAEVDYFYTLFSNPCERDDILNFNANGTFTLTDQGTKCSPSGDDSGVWSVSGNILTMDGDDATINYFNCSRELELILGDNYLAGDQLRILMVRQ